MYYLFYYTTNGQIDISNKVLFILVKFVEKCEKDKTLLAYSVLQGNTHNVIHNFFKKYINEITLYKLLKSYNIVV